MLLAVLFFSLMNVCAKGLEGYPPMEIVFFRCVISIVFSLYWLKKNFVPWQGQNNLRLVGRGLAGTLALYLFFVTLHKLPLATAVTLQYLSPIFTALLAIFMLNERIRPVQWLLFGFSFVGVAMLKGFDDRVSWVYLAIGVASAFFSGLAYTLVRSLKDKEHPLVVVFYFQLVGTVAGGVFSIGHFKMPAGWDWALLLAIGILAHAGQVNLTKAIQGEKVGVISSLNFLGAILGSFFGWLLFGEYLTPGNVLAILLVVAGVLLNLHINARGGGRVRRFLANLLNR